MSRHVLACLILVALWSCDNPSGPGRCQYATAPSEFTPCMPPLEMSLAITTSPSCGWVAAPSASWITLTTGPTGVGSGSVSFRVAANWEAPRFGYIRIRRDGSKDSLFDVPVKQAGCTYWVSTDTIDVEAGGGSHSFMVLQQAWPNTCSGAEQDACVWSAIADMPWISVLTPMPQHGDGPVTVSVAPNTTGSGRMGSVAVRGRIVRIVQTG